MAKDRREDGMDHLKDEDLDALPGGVALSWGIVKKPRRGPKGELSIKKIVDTAVSIADEDGLAAVSMSRVAQSLGFTTMSLYRYVTSKNDLLVLMQDAACEIDIPEENEGAGWREELRQYVFACMKVFREHPWFGDIPIQSVPLAPNNLLVIDWTLRIMKDFPINDFEKMSFVLLLSSYARAAGMIERDMQQALKEGDTLEAFSGLSYTAALKKLVTKERFPFLFPVLMSGAYTGETESPIGDDLAFGLEIILDGIEQYIETRRGMPQA
ncbi:TetR/AcrR family transcriptional regulator [Paenibacillus sp. HB172176]|uniref:TetR/AcrR family transcriptional regulator n=1 Tax=Paenibacillus sp. HB172176 TaxID=2493690 RepID=UPI001F0FE234|nr:TetR/AcrR family transcriptional regulator [Paenibacillus sp. HB172176]